MDSDRLPRPSGPRNDRRVAIIGGGISGLATAYFLSKLSKENGRPVEITLLEAGPNLGGVIRTERVDGFLLEKGPDAFITDKPWALALARELGLAEQLISTNAAYRRSFIARRGRLLPVPEGFYLVAPLDAAAFLRSPLVSWPGKIRMMAESLLSPRRGSEDESLASFVRRRFGREALERVAQPMLGGIYTGDPETLGLRATMPRFFELERKYGSLTRGLVTEARARKSAETEASGPRYSLFASFRGGMQVFSDALSRALPKDCVRTGWTARRITRVADAASWQVDFGEKGSLAFDAVCVTTPAARAALLIRETLPDLSKRLSSIAYESVGIVHIAYPKDQISHPLDGFGFVVPKTERKTVIACSFSSRKFEGRAPEGAALFRAFVGGAFGRREWKKSDEEILSDVRSELAAYLGIRGEPLFKRLERYPDAMVQYGVGHLDLVLDLRKALSCHRGLFLTGSSYDGVGIPDCVRAAEKEAGKILDYLSSPKSLPAGRQV